MLENLTELKSWIVSHQKWVSLVSSLGPMVLVVFAVLKWGFKGVIVGLKGLFSEKNRQAHGKNDRGLAPAERKLLLDYLGDDLVRSNFRERLGESVVGIELEKKFKLVLIERELMRSYQHLRNIEAKEPILSLFNEQARGLLVVVEPRSGKTVTLYQLKERLVEEARQDATSPVPLLIDLFDRSMNRKQSFGDWVVKEAGRR